MAHLCNCEHCKIDVKDIGRDKRMRKKYNSTYYNKRKKPKSTTHCKICNKTMNTYKYNTHINSMYHNTMVQKCNIGV